MIQAIPDSLYKEEMPQVNQVFNNIKNQRGFLLKWDEGFPRIDGVEEGLYKPGRKQPTEADRFITEVSNKSVIFDNSRFVPVNGIEYDFNYMKVDVDWQDMRNADGTQVSPITNLAEGRPSFKRTSLQLKPISAHTRTPWLMVEENLEGDQFLSTLRTLVAQELNFKASMIGLYGGITATPPTRSAMYTIDGMLKQLNESRLRERVDGEDPQGIYCGENSTSTTAVPIDFSVAPGPGDATDQLNDMYSQYSLQKGNEGNHVFYVSNQVMGKLRQLATRNRETAAGDNIYFEGGVLKLWGVPFVIAPELNQPANNYAPHILLGDLNSFAVGMSTKNIETVGDFNIKDEVYEEVTRARMDFLVIEDKDILAAPVAGLTSALAGGGAGTGASAGDDTGGGEPTP